MYVCFARMDVWALCLCSAHGGQERAMDAMALELRMVVNCHIGCWESNPGVLEEQQVL